ncbi:hypothetical protein N9L92_00685 [Saprospiraceae bacterium]|nr:hypothetical protein [Saprospiraceae bacterium]
MKITYLFIVLLSILTIGCDDDPELIDQLQDCESNTAVIDLSSCFSPEFGTTEDEQFFYNIQSGEINFDTNTNSSYSIDDGSKKVFIYRHLFENAFNIIDDEFEERVLFEIDNDVDSFVIKTQEDFSDANCTYGACGGSFPSVLFQNFGGSIVGERMSDCEWNIEANLSIEKFNGNIDTIQFSEIFLN